MSEEHTVSRLGDASDLSTLARNIKTWGQALGFQHIGICNIDLHRHEAHLRDWLAAGLQGEMSYMARHGSKRSRPAELVPGTVRVISARMDYKTPAVTDSWSILRDPQLGFISRYALGRDYHKVLRGRLQNLARSIESHIGPFGYRVFCDSAPVLEKALAQKAGIGWIGKHSNLINSKAGSWFFLGEIYTDLPLPPDTPASFHCGSCSACLPACPTGAIIAPFRVDARKCISYHTIELHGSIPLEYRRPMGNRIYGCDDCQLVCPWNKFAQSSVEADFQPRHGLNAPALLDLWSWSEQDFLQRMEGSPIRRIGYPRWLRNIAIALGNAPYSAKIINALKAKRDEVSELVREHIDWAIQEQQSKQ